MRSDRLIVVNGDKQVREMLNRELTGQGYDVRMASSAESALSILQHFPADLAILDIELQDRSGTELCRNLKSQRSTEHIPVVFYSGAEDEYQIMNAMESGADHYISSSASTLLLSKVVSEVLSDRFLVL